MKKILSIIILLLFTNLVFANGGNYVTVSGGVSLTIEEEDGSPSGMPTKLKVTNGDLTKNTDGSFSLDTAGGAGGGDSVTVNGSAVDTTANFKDTGNVEFTLTDGGAGGPDDISANVDDGFVGWSLDNGGALYPTTGNTMSASVVRCGENKIGEEGLTAKVVSASSATLNTVYTNFITTNTVFTTYIHAPQGTITANSVSGSEVTGNRVYANTFLGDVENDTDTKGVIGATHHISATFDPAGWYDQESNYRVVPLFYVGDDAPRGFTIVEWKVNYVGGDPTTELDADLCFDTTPDFNPADNMTVMDVINTDAGASSADSGFDSATAPNGSRVYIRFGADPADANVVIAFDLWFYAEED